MTDSNWRYYTRLFLHNIPFAITPFIGLSYVIITIPIISGYSTLDASAYSLYVSISTLVIFAFAALPPSVMKFSKSGASSALLRNTLLAWSALLTIVTFFALLLWNAFSLDPVLQQTLWYFVLLFPEILISVLCGLWSAQLILNKRGQELFKLSAIMLVIKLAIFAALFVFTQQVVVWIVAPSLITTILYALTLSRLAKSTRLPVGNKRPFSPYHFLKSVHIDSLDAIVISITFLFVIAMASHISPSALVISTIIMTTIRLVVLPLKRFGFAYGFEVSHLKGTQLKRFILGTLKTKYVALACLLPLIYLLFSYTNNNVGHQDTQLIFIIVVAQLLVEPIASYLTAISKYLGLGYQNLKYTIIYQWLFCLPIIWLCYHYHQLSLEILWGVMVLGRWGFAAWYGWLLRQVLGKNTTPSPLC